MSDSNIFVQLEYKRATSVTGSQLSTGRLVRSENGLVTEEGTFEFAEYTTMLKELVRTLALWPIEVDVKVVILRTDHGGLLPYALDPETVRLLRTDPVAGIAAMQFPSQSPSTQVQRVVEARVPYIAPPVRVGHAVLADSFGDVLYFKVRQHELECPGCGFWNMFISPKLLNDPERAGDVIKTAFVCQKKCKERFILTCRKEWGHVDTEYLLEHTKLDAFFFPRAWNEGRPWVSREALQKKYDEYKAEKESVCSKAT